MTRSTTQPTRPASLARRTMLALLASALGAVPLKSVLTDSGWLVDVWITMLLVVGPAAVLRRHRPPGALDVWPGIVALVPWLTLRFVPQHALAGVIPTAATAHDVAVLMTSLHETSRVEVAPVHSTVAIRLVLCALLGLSAALVDLLAVVGRRGALAAVPLLVIFTLAGAVPRHGVAWGWFLVAAVGFLILLSLDAADQLTRWGPRIASRTTVSGSGRGPAARTLSGAITGSSSAQRIGVLAVLAATVLPVLLPATSRNLVADALHHSHSGSGGGSGGAGGGVISPFADLKGQLERSQPIQLATVTVGTPRTSAPPFYLRSNVLDDFTGSGWRSDGHGATHSIQGNTFDTELPSSPTMRSFPATLQISGMSGTVPTFALPAAVAGAGAGTTWSPRDEVLLGTHVHRGQQLVESINEPVPTAAQLRAATGSLPGDMSRWLQLPTLPASIAALVARLTHAAATPYAAAEAISNFFTDPANKFRYDLKTAGGDSGNDLVDFLRHRVGFCQQYAASMGVLLRQAGVPARVVLGYMHPAPDVRGRFTVTSFDAHAWVEAYFAGVGWVPFDPTPIEGLDGGAASDIPYARHAYPSSAAGQDVRKARTVAPTPTAARSSAASKATRSTAAAPVRRARSSGAYWLGGALIAVLLALMPAALRIWRRRRRLSAARSGDPDPLWTELSDTALDLGYVWSAARSPRQVATWLSSEVAQPGALHELARAVESRRYARVTGDALTGDPTALERELNEVTTTMRARRSSRTRLRARLLPASLRLGVRPRRARHR